MELKYVIMTLIKILISVPTVLIVQNMVCLEGANGAALMGGHFDNKNATQNVSSSYYLDYSYDDSIEPEEVSEKNTTDPKESKTEEEKNSEEIPDPSPLVLPGYNLPENIFNKGKPFYLEKDPLTGQIDFNSKTPSIKLDDELYDYTDDEPSDNIYDKSNIDRKDGSLGSHRPSDVNQLTPNFHDFLNLPVKYNSDKYVVPLISSSYANTKIQGNVNKFHNHKDYNQKTTTKKPTQTPTYYSTNKNYFNPERRTTTTSTTTTTTTTTPKPTTRKSVHDIYLTTKATNLLNNAMAHPINEEFVYYENTKQPYKPNEIYLTTENVNNIYLTSKAPITTTKKELTLFEQLFGDYDETVSTTERTTERTRPTTSTTTTERTKPPTLFQNLPNNKYTKNKYDKEEKTEKPSYTTTSTTQAPTYYYPNSHAGPNVLTGSNMGIDTNEYEEYDESKYHENNNAGLNLKEINTTSTENPINTEKPTLKTTTSTSSKPDSFEYSDDEYEDKENNTITSSTTTTVATTTKKVTSLPLGDNHVSGFINRQPIIVATQNLKQKLDSEKVAPKPFGFEKPLQHAPSTSNVHIAPDQDMVSFVVGHHQSVEGGQYTGTASKESPYESNPFKPFYGQQNLNAHDSVSYTIQGNPEINFKEEKPVNTINFPETSGSAVTIQPLKNNEASLAIGVPVNAVHKVPGQVVDEALNLDDEKIEYPKGNGPKVVFPDEKDTTLANLVPPPMQQPMPNHPPREVLKLNSKPMYHQLPSDLTPPKEKEPSMPPRFDRPRPPWDPRPGHFYSGKPEYNRPPRPPTDHAYKRIDTLPNILPQFRPNMKVNHPPPPYYRQPLLERPSNRPIAFFEKLQPPPPPPAHYLHNLQNLRKIPPPQQSLDDSRPMMAEDRIMNEGRKPLRPEIQNQFSFLSPPKIAIANRRNGDDDAEVETLQMIQAKHSDKKEVIHTSNEQVVKTPEVTETVTMVKEGTDKPLYVVYPVNTPPIKLDVIDSNNKETVVIGTRAELPLPPSKINTDFHYDHDPLLLAKDRHDAPILKPHPRPPTFPARSDFPYPLERPDPSVSHPAVPEAQNNLDSDEPSFISGNQWNTMGDNIESRIVSGGNKHNSNQISVTLKTYTEKPIAVAYTPTEPNSSKDRFSMPNYASPVIPEIRPGSVETADSNEFTVSAVMHTHPQFAVGSAEYVKPGKISDESIFNVNHRMDNEVSKIPSKLDDFQAPFQASDNIDSSLNQGWAVVRDNREKNKTTTPETEVTTIPFATTSEFDIENFKPQLEGGFKPIYYSSAEKKGSEVNEREE
ncbi:unnamed protein product [Brassicogethes aeneus]|uniref:Uncharacterized protein n=1 Tax=Brassicogethes aeneus TaxID=1431903 RepID=A0A9P0FDB0_BRAAE|nr:unnamed protein product [Brassicogethes aeneus]